MARGQLNLDIPSEEYLQGDAGSCHVGNIKLTFTLHFSIVLSYYYYCCYYLIFQDGIFLCSLSYPRTCFVEQDGFELTDLPECWE